MTVAVDYNDYVVVIPAWSLQYDPRQNSVLAAVAFGKFDVDRIMMRVDKFD